MRQTGPASTRHKETKLEQLYKKKDKSWTLLKIKFSHKYFIRQLKSISKEAGKCFIFVPNL